MKKSIKKKITPENEKYWEHVKRVAEEVGNWPIEKTMGVLNNPHRREERGEMRKQELEDVSRRLERVFNKLWDVDIETEIAKEMLKDILSDKYGPDCVNDSVGWNERPEFRLYGKLIGFEVKVFQAREYFNHIRDEMLKEVENDRRGIGPF